jgi:predicted helicase
VISSYVLAPAVGGERHAMICLLPIKHRVCSISIYRNPAACGTGKTLVALWAAEAIEPKTVLVLVPSLALLSQTLPDWCKQSKWGNRFRYLCVCSDGSVDQSAKNDDYALNQSDLEFSVTTDAMEVRKFLAQNRSGVNVIFSTYQSAEVVAAGLKGAPVDFAVFDESHKTTGPKEGLFAFGLSDKNILIKKRLFLTATPRHYDLRKRDKDGDFSTVSMSDENVYGKVSYRLSFSAAVAAEIIVPRRDPAQLGLGLRPNRSGRQNPRSRRPGTCP